MRTLWTCLLLPAALASEDQGRAALEASIARQRAAIHKQAAAPESADSFFLLGPPEPMAGAGNLRTEPPDCPPLADTELNPLIESAARTAGITAEVLGAVVHQESEGRPCAVSRAGAVGLMQLMPAAVTEAGVSDAFDPKQNLAAGARLLKQLLDRYSGDLPRALAAYNAGPATVDRTGNVPAFPETQSYVRGVMDHVEAPQPPQAPKPPPAPALPAPLQPAAQNPPSQADKNK